MRVRVQDRCTAVKESVFFEKSGLSLSAVATQEEMGWKERREEMERDLTKGINILSSGGAMSTKKNSLGLGAASPLFPVGQFVNFSSLRFLSVISQCGDLPLHTKPPTTIMP